MKYCLIIFASLSFFALTALPGLAQSMVEAEGLALIEPDINISRDLAILRAKQQALETLGIGIRSKNIVSQGKLLDEIILIQTSGFVDSFDILEEGEQNGHYHVRLRAFIKSGKGLAEAHKSLFQERMLAISGKGFGSKIIEQQLRTGLASRFYHVTGRDCQEASADFSIQIDSSIEPCSGFGDIKSFYANASISMRQVSVERQVIYVGPDMPMIIYGMDLNQALNGGTVNQYPAKIAEALVESFWKKFEELEKRQQRIIKITIAGLPDLNAFNTFREYIKSIRLGMESLISERYDKGIGELEVEYREKSLYLASIIGYRSQYRVTAYQWDRIQVTYTKTERFKFLKGIKNRST